ncbi:MAG TPA: hypothetical protein VLB05_15525 [Dongiaceae bacterium]|jgi:hypothetical protein|nr:hypothetical protein [Dongiaceae bacterium]
MLASILIGLAVLIAVSSAAALLLFAHLTGRVRRATALAAAAAAMIAGAALAWSDALGPMAVPAGVFLMLAAGINGFLVLQSPKAARAGP